MKLLFASLCAAGLLLAGSALAAPAQTPASTPSASAHADPASAFAPYAWRYPVNRYRSANGMPGPDYWQNRVDYTIHARLDPANKVLRATETFVYTNHSPDTLGHLWLQMDQNHYRPGARGDYDRPKPVPPAAHTAGYEVERVEVKTAAGYVPAHTITSDTRMRVDLPTPLAAEGGQVSVRITYHYTVPGRFGGRTQWFSSKNGNVFEIAQWFPRLAVYDDLNGWNTLPYLNNEFYLEYGNIDYYVTVPKDMIVAGSGQLMNPEQVLSKTQRQRLARARGSAKTVLIRTAKEVVQAASKAPATATQTWHFRMQDTRDVAFVASRALIWDAARVDLPNGKHAMAMSVYPVEATTEGDWQHSTQHVKYTLEFFSRYLGLDYPWPNAVAVGGTVGGMEYPGVVFDWWKTKGYATFMLAVHEFGHTWFPMIVGSNERRDAWMDEGFNTFVDALAHAQWGKTHDGQYAPKKDGEYAPLTGDAARDIVTQVLDDPAAPPILTRPDAINGKYRHPVTYFKAAYGLMLLRDEILGPERFDAAFRQYVHAWAFKHPSPSDFFRAMDSAAGEDLSWFWRGWFAHNWKLDLAVTDVRYFKDDPAQGAIVTVANLGKLPMPATLQVTYTDGTTTRVRVPVAAWLQHTSLGVTVPGHKNVRSASIDPDAKLPDVHRANNRWPAD